MDTVLDHLWRAERTRVKFGDPANTFFTSGGIAIQHNNQLYGVLAGKAPSAVSKPAHSSSRARVRVAFRGWGK